MRICLQNVEPGELFDKWMKDKPDGYNGKIRTRLYYFRTEIDYCITFICENCDSEVYGNFVDVSCHGNEDYDSRNRNDKDYYDPSTTREEFKKYKHDAEKWRNIKKEVAAYNQRKDIALSNFKQIKKCPVCGNPIDISHDRVMYGTGSFRSDFSSGISSYEYKFKKANETGESKEHWTDKPLHERMFEYLRESHPKKNNPDKILAEKCKEYDIAIDVKSSENHTIKSKDALKEYILNLHTLESGICSLKMRLEQLYSDKIVNNDAVMYEEYLLKKRN